MLFDLSQTIRVEKRQVYDCVTLFGDLGGLNQFIFTVMTFIIGRYQTRMAVFYQVKDFFRTFTPTSKANALIRQSQNHEGLPSLPLRTKLFSKLELGLMSRLKMLYWPLSKCLMTKREKYTMRMVMSGESKLNKALDIRTIINLERAFTTLMHLEYQKSTRKLIKLQRR